MSRCWTMPCARCAARAAGPGAGCWPRASIATVRGGRAGCCAAASSSPRMTSRIARGPCFAIAYGFRRNWISRGFRWIRSCTSYRSGPGAARMSPSVACSLRWPRWHCWPRSSAYWPRCSWNSQPACSRSGGAAAGIAGHGTVRCLQVAAPADTQGATQRVRQPAAGPLGPVQLTVTNRQPAPLELELFDHVPPGMTVEQLPRRVRLQSGEHCRLAYRVQPNLRGRAMFSVVMSACSVRWAFGAVGDR